MYKMNGKEIQLKKLYALLEKIRNNVLGADYQTRVEMQQLENKVMERIKFIKSDKASQA
jgi:hypothetical protein